MTHLQPAALARYRGMSWAPVLFLLGFLVATGVLALFFLEPALRLANESPEARRRVTAYGALAICVLILVLLVGLVMTMRMGRCVAVLAPKRNKPTVYPDAWAESAKRIEVPTPEDLENPDDDSEETDAEKPKE